MKILSQIVDWNENDQNASVCTGKKHSIYHDSFFICLNHMYGVASKTYEKVLQNQFCPKDFFFRLFLLQQGFRFHESLSFDKVCTPLVKSVESIMIVYKRSDEYRISLYSIHP